MYDPIRSLNRTTHRRIGSIQRSDWVIRTAPIDPEIFPLYRLSKRSSPTSRCASAQRLTYLYAVLNLPPRAINFSQPCCIMLWYTHMYFISCWLLVILSHFDYDRTCIFREIPIFRVTAAVVFVDRELESSGKKTWSLPSDGIVGIVYKLHACVRIP